MTIDDLPFDRQALADLCRQRGILRLEIFGSFARGTAGPTSDVDVLVTFDPAVSLGWTYWGIPDELSAVFGRPVDMLTRAVVETDHNAGFRASVLATTEDLYHAAAA